MEHPPVATNTPVKSVHQGETTKYNPNLTVADQILASAQSSRDIVQDFCPLAESLEWELGQQYFRERGNKLFISDANPVPFVINNSGALSRDAAEVFFANLVESEKAGNLPSSQSASQRGEADIFVLELGIGVGLFARYFLDNFRELCAKNKKDYYHRLCYIAADRSPRMLTDVLRHGVLRNHPGRFRVRLVDAMEPEKYLLGDLMFAGLSGKHLRGIFLNYLLDCLPAAMLELSDTSTEAVKVKQLCVRTCVARNVNLKDHTDMTLNQLRERASSKDSQVREQLSEVYPFFASVYEYLPVDVNTLPYGKFAVEYARRVGKRILHSYGAIQCLEKLLTLVHDDGMILINDYGQTQTTREDEFEHQRFSLATAVGLNFPLLKQFFAAKADSGNPVQWIEPSGDAERGIHSRLLGHKFGSDTVTRFFERFDESAQNRLQESLQRARSCLQVGRFELAARFYREALKQQPRNWVLLNEIGMFLIYNLRDVKAGIDMAKSALNLNPTCSAELWNTLGDGLYEWGRTEEARSVYHKALAVNSSDVRSRYNLAWVHTRLKDYPAALRMLAQALSLDKTGAFHKQLLQKQQEVLAKLAQQNQQEYLLLTNLVSRHAQRSDKEEEATAKPPEAPDKRD